MRKVAGRAPPGWRARADRRLRALFDWFSGLPAAEAAALHAELMHTVMLRPSGLLLSGFGMLLMSGTALAMTGSRWAAAWLLADAILLAVRAYPTFWIERRGRRMSESMGRLIVVSAFVVFVMLGVGCAASFMTGIQPLQIVATASMMGLIAGLATRWAALPRLAIPSIIICSVPFVAAMIVLRQAGAVQFAIIAAATAALTLQNHRTLIAMIRAERRARILAETDGLTGLPNRSGLVAEVRRLHEAAAGSGAGVVTTMFIDLDHFKTVNDRCGHACGDRVLAEIGARLRAAAAPHFACRLGGDEFVVLQEGGDAARTAAIARRIVEWLGQPIQELAAEEIAVSASIGIATAPIASPEIEPLLTRADEALYRVKRAGRGHYSVAEDAPSGS